jgi:hypothetical protein
VWAKLLDFTAVKGLWYVFNLLMVCFVKGAVCKKIIKK